VIASLTRRHEITRPLDDFEIKLVRLSMAHPGAVHPRDEAALRYILTLAKLLVLRMADGSDLAVDEHTAELRDRIHARLGTLLTAQTINTQELARAVPALTETAKTARARVVVAMADRLSPEQFERELTHRALVVACGGGGGSGYGNLGAFALIESAGFRPDLIAGASMGAVIGLFRARNLRFDITQVPTIMGELQHRRLFRPFRAENRFTLPSPIRLALREGIGPYFEYDGVPLRMRDLTIPLLVTVTGIRKDALPRPLSSYLDMAQKFAEMNPFSPQAVRTIATSIISSVSDLVRVPDLLRNIVIGGSDETREFDAVDAVGFSSAVPGALHYDFARDAPAEVERVEKLFRDEDIFRLTDGGVVDNVPARTAWRAVQRGIIGTRNVFILALDGFSPRITTPLWLPLQRVARENVKRSIPYAHQYSALRRTLSPIELLPRTAAVVRIVESSKAELLEELPFMQRMLEPLPGAAALLAG
jgi:predicted acylesterase/phospholipase RssA